MKWSYIALGLMLLLSCSFLDNSRGPLLPVFSSEFHLSHTSASGFLTLGSLGGLLGTFLLIFLSRNITEKVLLKGLICFSMGVFLFSFTVSNYFTLLIFGFSVGVSISLLGAMANLVTLQGAPPEKRGKALSILHTMYGFGSFLAPSFVATTLLSPFSWKSPFLILGAFLLLVLGVSSQVLPNRIAGEIVVPQKIKLNRFQCFTVVFFSTYVAGEVMTSMWLVTYLVEVFSQTVTEASGALGKFFLMMMASRALTFFIFRPKYEGIFLVGSLLISIVFFILGINGNLWAFPLIGLFGPFFPLLLARVTRVSDRQSKTLTLWIIGVNSLFIMVAHQVVGRLADAFGLKNAFLFPCALLILATLSLFPYFSWEKKAQ